MCLKLKTKTSDFNSENRLEPEIELRKRIHLLLTTKKYKTHKFYALLNKNMKF
jgi:hypothetical protein